MSDQVADVPEFIQPRTIVDMTDEEYEAILNPIRDRRMVLVALHTQAVTLKNKVKSEKLITKIDKLLARVEKEVAKQDKTIEQIQLFHAQIRGLKIEAMELEDVE